tara:strand:- start:772 stop:1149 length:378 start_codon:yes stop_codon:yes gene_type:complete
MYAIVNILGKQFKAEEGKKASVPKIKGEIGDKITFDKILLIKDGDSTLVGNPILSGASISAHLVEHKRSKKILVYKKKRRKGYQRKNGHRQWYSEIKFVKIELPKATSSNKNKKTKNQNLSQEEE